MTTLASSGHPGGSMSTIDFLMTLMNMINIKSDNPDWEGRDRIVYSNGHISPAIYSTLALMGYFDLDEAVSQFRLAGSIYEGHVEPDVPGIEWASGNLGQGLSAACGFALGCRAKNIDNDIFVLMGDGEQQKGQLSEGRRFAVKYGLSNITAFCDYNKLQIGGSIEKVMPQNIRDNYLSDGWDVIEINGHDIVEIEDAIISAVANDKPTLILARTIMGKGVSFMENLEKYHGSTLSEEQLSAALIELDQPNKIGYYKELRSKFILKELADDSKQLKDFPLNTGKHRIYESKTDNRSAWGNAIADIAELNPKGKLAVFDCDLMGSVKTNGYASKAGNKFFQSGIMEHHTATMAGAMSNEGFQTYFADFGVFGIDETYNQHRLNDINETNLKVITTHVGLDVGEDGKTHQCIDYIGLMRNLYHFHTIVPADPNQTDHVIRYISGKYGNFLVPMGRSKLEPIKDLDGKVFFDDSYTFEPGKADLLRDGDHAAMFATGTLVGNAVKISEELKKKNINLQVWNISTPTDIDLDALKKATNTGLIFTYEDHNVNTGLGISLADAMMKNSCFCKLVKFGVENYAVSGNSGDVFKMCKLDIDNIISRIEAEL